MRVKENPHSLSWIRSHWWRIY